MPSKAEVAEAGAQGHDLRILGCPVLKWRLIYHEPFVGLFPSRDMYTYIHKSYH